MIGKSKEIDIAKNLRVIEWLKADLVDTVGALFKALLKKGDDVAGDALASIIIICYLLGRRIGIDFTRTDVQIKSKLNNSIDNATESEQWNTDLLELRNYLGKKR